MMVAEDFIKEPPAVPCCQKKNNGLSELDFSPRNSTVAKPECIILSPLVSLKGKNIVSRIFHYEILEDVGLIYQYKIDLTMKTNNIKRNDNINTLKLTCIIMVRKLES